MPSTNFDCEYGFDMKRPYPHLSEFAKHALALTKFLEENPPLDIVEQIFIENHLHVLRMGYSAWKRRMTSPLGQSQHDRC